MTAEHDKMIVPGTRVLTNDELDSTAGMLIKQKYLDARRPATYGTTHGWVPGHGGDVIWVKHDDGAESAYSFSEMSLVEPLECTEDKHIGPFYFAKEALFTKPAKRYVICEACGVNVGTKTYTEKREYITGWKDNEILDYSD